MPRPSIAAALGRGPVAWLVLLVLFVVIEVPFDRLGLPSPALFAGLLAGLIYALMAPRALEMPQLAITLAQAVIGAAIGVLISLDTVKQLGDDWLPVLVVCLATLALSVGAGFILRRHREVSLATGVFSMVAGGASGIVAIARDLGADERVVAVVQYLRVLMIIVGMPIVAQLVFHPDPPKYVGVLVIGDQSQVALPDGHVVRLDGSGEWRGVALLVIAVTLGLLLTRLVTIPAGALLLPLLIAVLISVSGGLDGAVVPQVIQHAAFAVIGVQVGLRFTRDSLRSVATLLPLALATIAGLIVVCALFGVALAILTGHSLLDGYLATTPGGLYAVLATAIGSNSDVTFVLTVQIVRLLVMLFSAPLLAKWLRSRTASS